MVIGAGVIVVIVIIAVVAYTRRNS